MKITVLGSGSTGNAVLIVAGNTRVLVDAGLSAKEIARRLAVVGEDAQRLDAVLVTHEHGDHAGGLRVLLGSVDCPVYISGKTLDAYVSERFNVTSEEPRRRAKALRDRVEQIESSKDFRIGEIDFHPFTIPHDAVDNFGFTATHQGVKIATVMDFGHITTLITEQLRGCAAIVIESNHSRDMLKACDNYPWELKQRILSRLGHLSNEDLADWITRGFDGCAQYLVLAHLSQRANNPYLAKINAEVALQERAPLFHGFTEVHLSYPKEPTPWIEV
jgi:phosphoribosyl 1,2-cyclic phosphodiesterase